MWIVAHGEADLSTREQLRTGLTDVDLGPTRLVYLDLCQLRFRDTASCRTLLRFERESRAAGYDVRIHRAAPILRLVMRILHCVSD